jgi:hypothetical protein
LITKLVKKLTSKKIKLKKNELQNFVGNVFGVVPNGN